MSCVDSWWAPAPPRENPPATLGSKLRALDHYATPFIDLAAVGLAVVGVVATDRWIRRKAGVRR